MSQNIHSQVKKILVIDDDQDSLELVSLILTSRGFDVQIHSTGLNVPEVVRNYKPDLILLDIRLPEKLGIEICKELKQIYSIPIILISGYSKHQISLQESKADGFIAKPFDIEQLMNTINQHLK